MKIVKNLKVIAAGAALVVIAGACASAEVSGGGSAASAINSKGRISLAIETKALCLESTDRDCDGLEAAGWGGSEVRPGILQLVRGEFIDSGKSAAWPYGVSMKFEGTFGAYPKDLAVNTGAQVDCPEAGLTCWYGLVGYQSTNERHYPNVPSAYCVGSNDGESLVPGLNEGISKAKASLRSGRSISLGKNAANGLAVILIIDSNKNGRIDTVERAANGGAPSGQGDMFMLGSVCGPYSSLAGLFEVTGTTNETDTYSYATCAETKGVWSNADPVWLRTCVAPLTSGNLKIKLLPTTTTTTLPEPPPTTP